MKAICNTSPVTPITNMKPPHVCSIPRLQDIDPFAEFEFSFPCEEFWWDEHDTSTSDYFSFDEDYSDTSSDEDSDSFTSTPSPTMIDTSFPSDFYLLSPITNPEPEPNFYEKDVLIQKLLSTICQAAPTAMYRRRKFSSRRKRKRRKRKLLVASKIEPELRMLWRNVDIVGVLPAKDPKLPPPSSLPSVNLASINKQMLRRLPDVVHIPVHSCSNDPAFYERNLPSSYDSLTSAFGKTNPFGALPAIWTDLGPVPPPTDACYGYMWTDGGWRVKAERPPGHVPGDPGGGHRRRGEVGGGHVGGAERRGWRNKNLCER